jgi:predicted MFS family arabinose efflux permease
MNKDQVEGVVRALGTAIGGYIVGKGIVDAATMTTIVGAVVILAGAMWSFISNRSGKTIV